MNPKDSIFDIKTRKFCSFSDWLDLNIRNLIDINKINKKIVNKKIYDKLKFESMRRYIGLEKMELLDYDCLINPLNIFFSDEEVVFSYNFYQYCWLNIYVSKKETHTMINLDGFEFNSKRIYAGKLYSNTIQHIRNIYDDYRFKNVSKYQKEIWKKIENILGFRYDEKQQIYISF